MAADDPNPKTVTTSLPISDAELKLLMRLRSLQKEIGGNRFRLELELDSQQIIIVDFRKLRHEVLA